MVDDRFDYPEPRFLTFGMPHDRMAMIAWTLRNNTVRVVSTRKCNEREQADFTARRE